MITLKIIEPNLYTYTHTHSDGNTIEYRVGLGKKIGDNPYNLERWGISIFSGTERIRFEYLLPDDNELLESPANDLNQWYSNLHKAKEVLEKYVQLCTDRNYPSPIELFDQSVANYRRAMRALVDKLIESNYRNFDDSRIDIDVVGGYDADNSHCNFSDYWYETRRHFHDENDELDHVLVHAEISKELADIYRTMMDAFDDPRGTGEFSYPSIELVEDSEERYKWCMRILVKNLIDNNFDPFAFPSNSSADFSIEIEPCGFSFFIRAEIKKVLDNDRMMVATTEEPIEGDIKASQRPTPPPNI